MYFSTNLTDFYRRLAFLTWGGAPGAPMILTPAFLRSAKQKNPTPSTIAVDHHNSAS